MKTAIMFSGQGAQYPGMMQDICAQYECAREIFDRASSLLGRDIYDLTMNATPEELNRTRNTQPALLVCELALLRVFQTLGLPCDAAMGFSLGEWAALVAAGVASEDDVIKAIEKRADAMQQSVPVGAGSMVVVLGLDAQRVSELCQSIGDITPANYNCPGNITVAGTASAGEKLLEITAEQGIMASKVAVSIPSHCALMEPAAKELSPVIQSIPFQAPGMEFIMNATGKPASNVEDIKENLIRQLCNPVQFQQSIEYLLENGYDTFIEVGPGKTLSGMVKRTAKQAKKKVDIMQFNSVENVSAIREKLSSR